MKTKPRLKWIACHRGDAIGDAVVIRANGQRIAGGSLRGCTRHGRSVFKIGRGCLLEFSLVIRVEL